MPNDKPALAFIDSNIWLYAFIQAGDSGKTDVARNLIRAVNPVVSVQVINEVCFNLLRKAKFAESQIEELIQSFYAKYPVVEQNQEILCMSSRLRAKYSLSFWDGLVLAAALAAKVSVVYSEDMQHNLRVEDTLTIVNPFLISQAQQLDKE